VPGMPAGRQTSVFHVTVRNSATLGVTAAELDTGGDRLDLATRTGLARTIRSIVGIVSQDAGMVTLEVR
jgi:hypothetical protein